MGSKAFPFYLYSGPRDFTLIYKGIHKISFLFIRGSTRVHFYLHRGSLDFNFVYMGSSIFHIYLHGVHEIKFEIKRIGLVWFSWVLWHIYHCRLFNAKSRSISKYTVTHS